MNKVPLYDDFTLSDLSGNWQDFILDMISLDKNSPALGSDEGVTLMLYALGKGENTITGNFVKGNNAEVLYNSLNRLLRTSKDLIPIFVASSMNSIVYLEDEQYNTMLEHIKKFIDLNKSDDSNQQL